MIKRWRLTALLLLVFSMPAWSWQVGWKMTEVDEANPDRPLQVALWYPTTESSSEAELIGDNTAFNGVYAIKSASPIAQTPKPLVLLSHGYRGNWRNMSWLAARLAEAGYLVAAPNHPGTTTFNTDPVAASQWYERPRDLSRIIDKLTANPEIAGAVDLNRIAAIGHSLGGWTVMNIAGATTDIHHLVEKCRDIRLKRGCSITRELGLTVTGDTNVQHQGLNVHDTRISAVVSLDLGLAHSFLPATLKKITTPVLIIAAGTDTIGLPYSLESGYLAKNLPISPGDYQVYQQASHFSFIQRCKPSAQQLIEAESPGDGIVCVDGTKKTREQLHATFTKRIMTFLEENFTAI
ncbi:alpha/beta hydrolase family protein [Photobacterium kasasachensis]|uniref:alpha/beta hydrolase family protein n=1 Tax=Photobacterium kasasachensis TaxID=2910240 RepID=UPI003D131EB9